MSPKQYHYRLFALSAITLAYLCATFSLRAQSLAERNFSSGVADSLSLSGLTCISFGDRVLLHDLQMSVASLDSASVPPMDYGMTNVTVQGEGCRFLPHGTHFGGEGATVRLSYDRTRIPSGYTEDDIRTYYYDTSLERWVALERIEVDRETATVVSRTTHFTDMINGVIVAPETPETGAFVPTMMSDIQAADPTSKLTFITPPTANNRGSANLQYPFEMPPARNGMQPSLVLTYDSDGGSGWAGEGWDLRIPAITVDTRWGVPRYSSAFESETYLLNGQMLAMMSGGSMTVAHRQDSIPRDTCRLFFVRQGGDFSKIVRHGNNPNNYWWEVTGRDGTVYTYGNTEPSRVHGNYKGTADSQPRDVIAEWRLTGIRETHGDRIDYIWQADTIYLYGGTFAVRDLWLSQVTAKNKEHAGPHTRVTFHNREQGKAMSANSARYGFLTASTHLLESVDVDFRAGGTGSFETLRTYALAYENGKFGRERLLQLDHIVSNDTVSFQKFKYYDDATEISNSLSTFAVDADSIKGGDGNSSAFLPHKIGDIELRSVPSALGGTFSRNYSGSLYAGVGYGTSPGKTLTGGLALGYGQSNSTGEATLVDLDGDGLPDKVRKTNNGLEYCRQTLTDGVATFDNPVPVQTNGVSLSNFSRSKTSTTTIGGKGYVGVYSFTIEGGVDRMTSTSRTTHYFADVNGDGLVDLVNNGHVYFNHIEYGNDGKPRPTFTNTSADTPSPINNNGAINTVVLDAITEDMDTLVESSPMQDIVRYWVAPMDGNVCIDGTVTRQLPSGIYDQDEYAQADSLHVAIEYGDSEVWGRSIAKDDDTAYTSYTSNINVQAGDSIFFRLQSGRERNSDGSFDKVLWPVTITYTDKDLVYAWPNGHSPLVYAPSEDNVSLWGTGLPADTAALAVISSFDKPVTSDAVTLTVRYHSPSVLTLAECGTWTREAGDTTAVYTEEYTRGQEVQVDNAIILVPSSFIGGTFSFEVSSPSNIRWEDVSWRPSLRYIYDLGTKLDTAIIAASPRHKVFNRMVNYAQPHVTDAPFLVGVPAGTPQAFDCTPQFDCQSNVSGQVTLTFKTGDTLHHRRTLQVTNGSVSSTHFRVILPAHEIVWVEYFTEDTVLANANSLARVCLEEDTLIRGDDEPRAFYQYAPASVYTVDTGGDLGPTHRGWGQFVYNAGGNRYARPIVTDSLSMPRDSASCDPRSMKVTLLTPSNDDPTLLMGGKQDIYIHGDTLSAARLTENHVLPDSTLYALADAEFAQTGTNLKGTGARGITLVSKSTSTDGIAGVSLAGLSLSGNTAGGNCETKNAFMDMNGDGYPDIVTEEAIQYTNSHGGFAGGGMLDRTILGLAESEERMFSTNEGYNIGFGGSPIFSHSTIRSGETARLSAESATAAVSLTLANSNKSESKMAYTDINGDGLPDLVSCGENSQLWLRLNMGYGFSSRIALGLPDSIQTTHDKTQTVGLSGSFNIGASSFAGGASAAATKTTELCAFIDVNGDGLPDRVYDDRGTLKVRQNLGDAFATAIVWNGLDSLERHGATSRSENVAFTYSFTITPPGIKIAISPALCAGKSMSQPQLELRDIDGDGFIDILESDGENDLRVRRSTIRRTNRLRSVTNSLGGTFEIDYEHSTPTYGLPGGKWVMSSVTVDRGIHGTDYDIPNTRQIFEYAHGVRDRHEREFLGFHEVTTMQVDPGDNDAPLRQTVEVYDTASVYTAGNLLQTYVADPQGNPYVKTENRYYKYSLTNDCDTRSYSGGRFSFNERAYHSWNDRGAAYCPTRFTETRRYEGGADSAVMAQEWYQYYDRAGDHGLVRNYRHRVGGGLNENGTGTYDYQTNIEYSYNLSDTAYIIGLPKRVKVTNGSGGLYHLTEAGYNLHHPNQLTQVKRLLSIESIAPDPEGPVIGPIGREGEGTNGIGDGIGGGIPYGRYNPDQEPNNTVIHYPNPVYAITDYSYDNYGNLLSTTLPMGSDSTRVQYQYHHETTQNTYLSGIVDSYGLHSHSGETDYHFGITNKQVDKNGAVYRTANDNIGRLTSVKSPMDSASATPAMRLRYHPRAMVTNGVITTPAYATTVYYFPNTVFDNEVPITYTDSMRVVTFVDGFGRPIQVRKDGVVWEGSENVNKTIVTGRTDYDGYGRAVHSYYPSTASANTVEDYTAGAQQSEYYTSTAYDLLDREIAVTLPDNTTTSYQYGIDGNTTTTTVIDANGNASRTVTDGDGRTVRSIQYKGGVGAEALTTQFAYDDIGRLVTVTDTEGNTTRSAYDLGDRRTSVIHPASGETKFTYDALGNVTTRQTANLSGKGQYIRFIYEQGRLKRVSYPEHPENDVIYHYGDENAEQGLRGRVKFREDGSGGNEYHYDLLGNVSRMKRTVTIPGNTIATAEMTWTYDNFGKLKQMQFPRTNGISERITYHYDRAGQLQSVYNGDLASYHYIQEIGYDKFGDRVHIKYGNDVENNLSYRADNRRLYTQTVTGDGGMRMHRSYSYDPIGNITGMSTSSASLIFPSVSHYYYYDNLNRLYRAQGHTGINSTSYRVDLGYDNLYRITSKRQTAQRSGPQDQGTYYAGYNLGYSYNQSAGKKFQMSTVSDTNYRTALVAPTANDSVREAHSYEYDNNGNILYVNTLRLKPDMTAQPDTVQRTREEKFRWDEENRLTALSQNGYVSHYWYDADGERTVKMHGGSMAVFVNSERDGRMLDMQPSTAYFSPYFSIQGNSFTKHLYIGSERVASMTGTLSPGDVSNSPAGGYNISHAGYDVGVTQLNIPYATKLTAMSDSAEANYAYFDLPNALEGQSRQTREFVLPAEDSEGMGSAGSGTGPRGDNTYNGNIWFIHADHLGSSTLVTDGNGGVSQQIEYLPYGEVFLEKQSTTYATPYKFNGKELDEETGLYYYGARYMNPRLSIWYGCDPLQEKYPDVSTYCYTFSNPIRFIDEYGDKPQKSRIEYRGNGIFGININSLSAFSRNDFKRRNNDPRNWTPGEIGINTTVAKLLTITEYTSLTTNSDYSAAGLDQNDAYLKTRAELAKSTGLPDKRVRSHEVFALGSCNSKSIKGSAAFMIMLNVAAVALDYYVLFSANSDYEAIINQKIQLQSAMDAVLNYMKKNDIPSKYRDKHNLGAIINYVFQGENSTGDQRISEFGKLILKANGRYDKNSNQYVPFIQK